MDVSPYLEAFETSESVTVDGYSYLQDNPAPKPSRTTVVRPRGSGGGRTLLLNAHMDVVGGEGMTDPFRPRIEGDRLYGRGAYDMKAGLAAISSYPRSPC